MSDLEDVYDGGSRWWATARALLLLVGSLVATVGFVAATASLVAGFGLGKASALKVAALLGGGLLLGGFLVLFARGQTRGRSRTLAVVGAVFAVVGLTLFWTTLPAGWTGRLVTLPPVAAGTYAVGLLAVFVAGLASKSDADTPIGAPEATDSEARDAEPKSPGGVESESLGNVDSESKSIGSVGSAIATGANEQGGGPASSAVGDGGENEDDLQFFDGDES